MRRRSAIAIAVAVLAGAGEFILGNPHAAVVYAIAVLTGIFIGQGLK